MALKRALGVFLGAGLCLLVSTALVDPPAGAQIKKGNKKNVLEFVHLNEKGFPLNVNPEIVAAKDAPIDDGDMVMGIVLNGEARAYPVNYMNGPTNEVVNDRLGGQAIAPSW